VKSGTNQFHGSAYDLPPEPRTGRQQLEKQHDWKQKRINTQNDFGFTAGGPVYFPHLYHGIFGFRSHLKS